MKDDIYAAAIGAGQIPKLCHGFGLSVATYRGTSIYKINHGLIVQPAISRESILHSHFFKLLNFIFTINISKPPEPYESVSPSIIYSSSSASWARKAPDVPVLPKVLFHCSIPFWSVFITQASLPPVP